MATLLAWKRNKMVGGRKMSSGWRNVYPSSLRDFPSDLNFIYRHPSDFRWLMDSSSLFMPQFLNTKVCTFIRCAPFDMLIIGVLRPYEDLVKLKWARLFDNWRWTKWWVKIYKIPLSLFAALQKKFWYNFWRILKTLTHKFVRLQLSDQWAYFKLCWIIIWFKKSQPWAWKMGHTA